MSGITNVGPPPSLPPVGYSAAGEKRSPSFASGQRGAPAEGNPSVEQTKPPAADAAKGVEKVRAKPAQDQIALNGSRQLAAKSGLVEGSFEPFIDIIDPRYQTRIARIFGPEASASAPETASVPAPRVVSKAYEAIDGTGKAGFAKTV